MRVHLLLLTGLLAAVSVAGHQQPAEEELEVLSEWLAYSDAENSLYHHFRARAQRLLDERAATVGAISSESGWKARREQVRRSLLDAIGAFPERTPLNPRITGVVTRDGFRVEKLVYESVPSFYVTAALFIPDALQAPAPAILFCSGHSADGFRAPAYQTMILNLVSKGFVVLAFDPVGQGERLQYIDPATGESPFGPTREHSYPGAQQLIVGDSPARMMIWDGIRGIDYLVSRDEVDPERVGVAGRSGGGTQSSFVAAVDERVLAAAPEAYITSYSRLLASRGPQDAEQNFMHGIALGLDHADLLEVRAPKPTLVITTTRDIFSIQGARETVAEARRAFAALGSENHLEMVEDDEAHASTRRNREAMYGFFQRRLDLPGDASEDEALTLLTADELQVTQSGQVATSLVGETTFSLNRRDAQPLLARLESSRARGEAHLEDVRRDASRLSGFIAPDGYSDPVFAGRYARDGYHVEKHFISGEGDYVVPFLLFVPGGTGPFDAVVYLHPEGKAVEAEAGGEIETLVREGFVVAAPDLVGLGEMGPGRFRGDAFFEGTSYNVFFAAMLVGRSIVATRSADTLRVASFLEDRDDVRPGSVTAVARGAMGPVLLHAAALDPDGSFAAVATLGSLVSYRSLVEQRDYQPELVHAAVAGALTDYDLPDLAASLAPRPLFIGGAIAASGNPMDIGAAATESAFVSSTYGASGNRSRFVMESSDGIEEVLRFLRTLP